MTRDEVVQAFLRLVGTGEIDKVRQVLAAAPQMVDEVGPHPFWAGRAQPLHVAIETRRRDLFDLLIAAGADIDGDNDAYDYWSPLMLAINRDRPDMRDDLIARGARIGLLVAAGADRSAVDEEHHGTPLGWAEVAIDVENNPRCQEVVAYLAALDTSNSTVATEIP